MPILDLSRAGWLSVQMTMTRRPQSAIWICMAARPRVFADRAEAGIILARELQARDLPAPLLVLAIPRGGVAVAYQVARVLQAPLDVMLVRKVGLPEQPELAMGAIASGGIVVHDREIAQGFPGLAQAFDRVAREQQRELERRESLYRRGLDPLELSGRTVILVDDGLATGSTMLAALRAARKAGGKTIVAAAPVASPQAAALVRAEADATIILETPQALLAVGEWYQRFEQLEDDEVCRLLELSRRDAQRKVSEA